MPTTIRPVFNNLTTSIPASLSNFNRFANAMQITPNTFIDGVFEGGATLGTAYIGSLRVMQQSGLWFQRVAGNSAGAITAAMIAAGYNATDMEWLSSGYPNRPPRPAGVPAGLQPLDFMDFLDFPAANSISVSARRKTLLWKILKGEAIDHFLDTKIPVPTRGSAVNSIVSGLKSIPALGNLVNGPVETAVRGLLNNSLSFLPTSTPKLKDFSLFDTEPLRRAYADAVWQAVAHVNPLLVMQTHLLHEGAIWVGDEALAALRRILGAKVHNNQTATVLFNQLPIPLAVIGANIRTGRMEVYSSRTHPNMEVAEAVRRSMSLPVIFQPRGSLVVDGGLCSNLPAWLFTTAGDRYWPVSSIDAQRAKVAFCVDESAAPPAAWGVSSGKFNLSGNPPRINLQDVLTPMLVAKLRDAGLYVPTANFPQAELEADLGSIKLFDVIVGSATMGQEESVRDHMLRAMFPNSRFFHVDIPLLGYHGFDFAINGDKVHFEGIAQRGWFAARDGLAENPAAGAPLITNPAQLQNPF
jgi:predicted acylesterase/phospholipase RssA